MQLLHARRTLETTPDHPARHLLALPPASREVDDVRPQPSTPSASARGTSALSPREKALADAVAERVAERLRAADDASPPLRSPRLVDARAVAAALNVDLKSIYRHSAKLGAVRVGRRLRFDLDRALRSWSPEEDDRCHSEKSQPRRSSVEKRSSSTPQSSPDDTHCQLLPVGRWNRSE
jgi:hypothetical protein